ncbi:hypothetical protein GTW51_10880 [Aurantimonas aggregata]|uniref:Cytochrome c domain-containing protein n=1 Tax=Aurantimonas aggregata TaxID=2047720 RepID=A0A6L9MHA6_9HYPH|nr:hypothetical protein [Aurantimonas aggregata]NDV87205.1 hypothetical protein [Aurantimonas aggregata]
MFETSTVRSLLAACAMLALAPPAWAQSPAPTPNQIQQAMYFLADRRDGADCRPAVADGSPTWPATIGNPAISCPDAFGWTSFLSAIDQRFWTWGTDQTIWVDDPKPLCGREGSPADCCDSAVLAETPPLGETPMAGCPYYPPDWSNPPPVTVARPASSHSHDFLDRLDPSRVMRQEEAEIVYRNRPFVRYSFEQNLYNKEGLGARFTAMQDWISANAPYQNDRLAVDYPADAVMFKVDYLSQTEMLENGLIQRTDGSGRELDPPNNPAAPYITLLIEETLAPGDEEPELYYLVAVTAASKAVPNWHWYAIEHVGNLGRCDFIGCNDSFGVSAAGVTVDGRSYGQNYIPPKTQNSEDSSADIVFDPGTAYTVEETGEEITPELDALMTAMGIGTGAAAANADIPSPADPAWRSYRLKASQTDFVTATGMPTHNGQSITEGGFVDSASCITCHAQAGPDALGNPGIPGIGARSDLNMFGLNQTVNGAPDPEWYFAGGTNMMRSLPMDFVWGMLNATCIAPEGTTGNCQSYAGPLFAPPVTPVPTAGNAAGAAPAQ